MPRKWVETKNLVVQELLGRGNTEVLAQWLIEIEARMRRGETFDQIEDEINGSSLDDEQKSAVWLFAWSCQTGAHQRLTARQGALQLGMD